MSNTDIKWFSFGNTNAPQLSNSWGCMIDVLDACLVTGMGSQLVSTLVVKDGVATATFGTSHNLQQFQVVEISNADQQIFNGEHKVLGVTSNTIEFVVNSPDTIATGTISCKLASLGWTKAFSGTQKAVYSAKDRTANPYFLRVDNSLDPVYNTNYAKYAKVGILDSCTDIDDLTGNQAPFDPTKPSRNWADNGWFKWRYASSDQAAASTYVYESTSPANGNRPWVLIGTKDSFYIINSSTISAIFETPYGFGVVQHKGLAKPFLSAVNQSNSASNTNIVTGTSLSNTGKVEVAAMTGYSGALINTRYSRLISGFGSVISGAAANSIKSDPTEGYILSPIYFADPDGYIMDALPLVQACVNDATATANYAIFSEPNKAYIGCRMRSDTGGVLGMLFFTIYDGE
ncbi:hypothetical protein HUN33_05080 [Acinetobacter bereziniae]|uniref:hypothetical protein n=1 Tax=Acinetobacter bereziniae TaxID=106648 RepID=UPI00157FDF2F|nr:hypothetical protein [Acinetobacter bereziniae]NUF63950.1 hypothetical protein [Acinetobacter bereziniae]NUG07518.1 hypothetical protein [Acinetobacter bereziniae]NUG64895.1 hypothetical protein [Acinetobacter bereziniae]NUG70319.1 hypothetical protein [Acinetobacter bereziniae]NUG79431.1 hypothetical protein [Acinetobacter bereziniae]